MMENKNSQLVRILERLGMSPREIEEEIEKVSLETKEGNYIPNFLAYDNLYTMLGPI